MGFYDFKGYWRNEGEGFYDAKGNWVNPGAGFYDSKGYFRKQGEGFYDAKGNWINPGAGFYDAKGYYRSNSNKVTTPSTDADGNTIAMEGMVLFVPLALLCVGIVFLVDWITTNLYIFSLGYIVINACICWIITKVKRYKGANFWFSYWGNFISILSFAYLFLLYAVPYMKITGKFFDFLLTVVFGIGAIVVIQFFNYYHEKPLLEVIVGVVCYISYITITKSLAGDICSLEKIMEIYHLKSDELFRFLFGIAV